jgi:hypothetical protein
MKNKLFWVWLVLTLTLDICQFAIFECSIALLSLTFGVPFFGAMVWTTMKWFTIYSNELIPHGKKIVNVLIATLLGLGIIVPSGILLLLTHICS